MAGLKAEPAKINTNLKPREAHLLVDKDSVEFRWGGEKGVSHAEFTGGDLDASVNRSCCAAGGGNLFHKRKKEQIYFNATKKKKKS